MSLKEYIKTQTERKDWYDEIDYDLIDQIEVECSMCEIDTIDDDDMGFDFYYRDDFTFYIKPENHNWLMRKRVGNKITWKSLTYVEINEMLHDIRKFIIEITMKIHE